MVKKTYSYHKGMFEQSDPGHFPTKVIHQPEALHAAFLKNAVHNDRQGLLERVEEINSYIDRFPPEVQKVQATTLSEEKLLKLLEF